MMLIDTMKIKEELAKYFPEPKPKNSPEITTVLASIAEILAQDEDFHNFSIPTKRMVLLLSGLPFIELFQIKTDHVDEFIHRYAETIVGTWGAWEGQADKQDKAPQEVVEFIEPKCLDL